MGLSHAKIFVVIAIFAFCFSASPAEVEDASVVLSDFKLPEYNKNTKELEFIISGAKARTMGVLINLSDVKIDWVDKDIHNVKATVTTPSAVYDRVTKTIRGDEALHFRSPEMDADGIGFDADYEKQTIHIRSNVRVILKNDIKTMYKEETNQEK